LPDVSKPYKLVLNFGEVGGTVAVIETVELTFKISKLRVISLKLTSGIQRGGLALSIQLVVPARILQSAKAGIQLDAYKGGWVAIVVFYIDGFNPA